MNNIEMLRIIADDYDQAQRVRIAKGEQIRAIAQGRDQQSGGVFLESLGFAPVFREGKEIKSAADLLLATILRDKTNEPSEYLAWGYRAEYEKERRAYKAMSEALETHPVWNWMKQIRGVGPTLAAKLLSRLDIDKTSNGSSFLSYCGLGTVPGQRWKCAKCGWVGIFPATYKVTGKHKGCKGVARLTHIHPGCSVPKLDINSVNINLINLSNKPLGLVSNLKDVIKDVATLSKNDAPGNLNTILIDEDTDLSDIERYDTSRSIIVADYSRASEVVNLSAFDHMYYNLDSQGDYLDDTTIVEFFARLRRMIGSLNSVKIEPIRAAQPKAEKGEKRSYDAFAKKTMYLLAMSWIKAGSKSFYNKVYRDKVAYYDVERPGWERGRKHYSALRAAEKMFLSHVYEVWCNEIGRDPGTCYAEGVLGHEGIVSAQEVIEWEQVASQKVG